MKEPAAFLAKALLLGGIVAAVVWLISFEILPPDYREPFAITFVKQAYLGSAASPKIIILGGSNALYGIDSGLLEQRLGRPVANMSLQVGIPLTMQINQVESALKPGDLVVLSLEYGYYVQPNGANPSLARLLEVYPQGAAWLDPVNLKDLPAILKIIFQGKYDRLRSTRQVQLAPAAQVLDPGHHLPQTLLNIFSPQGDLLAHLDQTSRPVDNNPFLSAGQLNPRFLEIVNNIAQRARARGAVAALTFPSSRQSNCTATDKAFTELYQRFKTDLSLPMIGSPQSYCFPDTYFFDTSYHLLREGRRVRTEQMAVDLRAFIQ